MVARPVSTWFPRPLYAGLDLGLVLSCGHVRWVRQRHQAGRLAGRTAECLACARNVWVSGVLDWS